MVPDGCALDEDGNFTVTTAADLSSLNKAQIAAVISRHLGPVEVLSVG